MDIDEKIECVKKQVIEFFDIDYAKGQKLILKKISIEYTGFDFAARLEVWDYTTCECKHIRIPVMENVLVENSEVASYIYKLSILKMDMRRGQ